MKNAKELVGEANMRVKTIPTANAKSLLNAADTVFVDLRDSAELQRDGKIPGAVHVKWGNVGVRARPDIILDWDKAHAVAFILVPPHDWKTRFKRLPGRMICDKSGSFRRG
jgi:rhodanese-related sulfurtransferase